MHDYSKLTDADGRLVDVPIVRGYPWPAGGRAYTLQLVNPDGWTEGVEDAWTWTLLFDALRAGGAAAMSADAVAAAISGDSNEFLDLDFMLDATETDDAPGAGNATAYVDLASADGVGEAAVASIWAEAHGTIQVRNAVGAAA